MAYEIEKIYHFEAGHVLTHHDGKCCQPHGHSYVLRVKVRSETLQESGPQKNMVMDFDQISSVMKPLIAEQLDHKWLNDTLKTDSPTAEYIAKWIFDYLEPHIAGLYEITVYETASSSATYRNSIALFREYAV